MKMFKKEILKYQIKLTTVNKNCYKCVMKIKSFKLYILLCVQFCMIVMKPENKTFLFEIS